MLVVGDGGNVSSSSTLKISRDKNLLVMPMLRASLSAGLFPLLESIISTTVGARE